MRKILLLIFCVVASLQSTYAFELRDSLDFSSKKKQKEFSEDKFLPNSKRFNRDISKLVFAYKGELVMGATFSYGNFTSENTEVLLLVDGISADATLLSVKPYLGYFYSDNHCIGARFGFNKTVAKLDAANIDLGEGNDIEMSIPYIGTDGKGYTYGVFHRSYIALDKKSRFGLFGEVELQGTKNSATTGFEQSGVIERTRSETMGFELNFNPGAAVYIMPNVCTNISLGFGGLNYKSIKQYDESGNKLGGRQTSKMSFKFNVLAINFGITIHMWGK